MRGLLICAAEYSQCVKFPAALEIGCDVCAYPTLFSAKYPMSYT